MKFLLAALNTKYIHSNPAIYSLRAYVSEEKREHVELAEYTINNSVSEILADIYVRKPDVIGFSCYIWNITMILELVRELPKLLPNTPIWLGGPEVTYRGAEFFPEYPGIAGIMVGEGEVTFSELLDYYLLGEKELGEIAGLSLPGGFTSPRELTDISSLPFLYQDLQTFENKIIYYESSRGCPFRCSYCLSSIDKKVRLRNIETVKRELQFFLDNKVRQVKFVDRTFNCNHDHAIAIWKYILEHDNGVTNFHFEVSADILNEEELSLLSKMRPGLAQLEIGVQSTHPETIKAINRSMNVEKLEQIVARINAGKNVHQHLDLIAGLPYEDYDTFVKSFNRVYSMEPEQLQLGFLKLLRGSEMWDRAKEFGICCMDKPPYEVLYTKWLSYEDVLRLKKVEEMVEMYYNSNQFVHTIRFLERAFEHPFALYEALAEFYEKKGYFLQSPARGYRYHVLLHFAMEQDGANEVIYKELLTYDMYLRENLKSRPDFAGDMGLYKERSRGFYEKEAQERKLLPDYEGYDSKQLSKMTHLEAFHYAVWEEVPTYDTEPKLVLFDYKHRNPLNGDARTVVVG
ncbi:MAG: B12-binding domain-containing radical SAM protein [Lachnospiraceae bacterium]|nr:B12-binding domain-containing radical SAM protein [Lachnospiraceae bacterium]